MSRYIATVILALLLTPTLALAQNVVTVTDADVTGDVTWTSDNIYVLDGFVFVEDGSTLTIEPGTVIKGKPGTGENASALIVARGGKIFAEGTATEPIIFTAEADDVSDPNDLPLDARGLWGGVIILGKASLNSSPGETAIEGIPTTEPRGVYGCGVTVDCDDADNSGVLRYVSIRHGGADIGAGNEINGLTLGGVGSGTTIEYIEVFNNADDGFEWFGGTAETRYLVSAFNGDDAFDYDEGWRGKGQFWFVIQSDETANRGGEHDGGTDPEDGQPYATPTIANVTFIGSGAGSANADNDFAIVLRDNAGGRYYNSIFTDFFGAAVSVEDLDSGEDSRARLEAGDLVFQNNIFGVFGAGTEPADLFASSGSAGSANDWLVSYMTDAAQANQFTDPLLRGVSRTTDGGLDPRPAEGSPALSGAQDLADDFFVDTDYIGAFGQNNWAAGWTFISDVGILTDETGGTDVAEDADLPQAFSLEQNYPNPFNPSTTIEFTLDRAQDVRLTVFDVTGREVAVLVDGLRPTGSHVVTFDARDLTSGLYLYRLETAAGTATRTMMLVK